MSPQTTVTIPISASGEEIITDDISGDNVQVVKQGFGDADTLTRVTDTTRLPVEATLKRGHLDSFQRMRVSNPETLFDSKLLFGKEALHWDEDITDTSGNATSTHTVVDADVTMHVETDDAIIRQTFRRFPYQPGKSQLIFMTGILASATGSGVLNRIGYFDSANGLFFEADGTTINVVTRKNSVDTEVAQSAWNLDNLDGDADSANPSGHTLDTSKTQIFVINFEWLGVGSVWFGFVINGEIVWVHRTDTANSGTAVYMTYPNLPLRYEASTTSTTTEVTHICSTVMSEGGIQQSGQLHYASTLGTHLDANSDGTLYALVGARLNSSYTEACVSVEAISIVAETNDDFEWILMIDPTVASTFTYSAHSSSAIDTAFGATANTITGGTPVAGGWAAASSAVTIPIRNQLAFLGTAIDGTERELVLCVRPVSANADFQGAIQFREIL